MIHGEPLRLTPEQRASLPPLPPLDPTVPVEYAVGVSRALTPHEVSVLLLGPDTMWRRAFQAGSPPDAGAD